MRMSGELDLPLPSAALTQLRIPQVLGPREIPTTSRK